MRKTFIGLGIVLALALICSSASATPTLTLKGNGTEVGSLDVLVGETFTIVAYLDSVVDMSGFQLRLDIDLGLDSPIGMTAPPTNGSIGGSWYETTGEGLVSGDWTVDAETYDPGPHKVASMLVGVYGGANWVWDDDVGDWVPGEAPPMQWAISGSGDIATFTFKGKALGTTVVDLAESILGDADAEPITHNLGTALTINVVPEPFTLTLLGAGLLGLVAYKRRK